MIYKKIKQNSTIKIKNIVEGETLENKVRRILDRKEPIKDGAPIIYMERKDGVNPDCDIRTDRFEAPIDATDYISRSKIAKRMDTINDKTQDKTKGETQGTTQGTTQDKTQGTNNAVA